ncbi:MAG TPA: restriction endonuclease subunit S, partial [Bacteroidia bacterium]|nr:restriction endonuclease subunit S [Bacteroidia bacterium]
MSKLGEFVTLESGNGFPEIFQGNQNGKYPFIKVSDFNLPGNEIQINTANNYVDEDLVQKLFLNIIPPGSTVFAKVGAAIYLNRRRVIIRETILDNNLMAAIPKDIHSVYLYHLLVSIDLTKFTQQGALPSLSNKIISNIEVNIPCKNQQNRIATILSTCDSIIEKTQAAIAKYKAIKQGMLQDLFTRGIDPNTNKLRPRYEDAPELYKESKLGWIPREWEVEKIGKIFRFNQGVQCPVELQKLHQGENEVRFIRIIDLTNEGEPPRYIADPGSQYHI